MALTKGWILGTAALLVFVACLWWRFAGGPPAIEEEAVTEQEQWTRADRVPSADEAPVSILGKIEPGFGGDSLAGDSLNGESRESRLRSIREQVREKAPKEWYWREVAGIEPETP